MEKSELDVLEGVAEEDWKKIDQIVVEVHDLNGRVARISELLTSHAYSIAVEQEKELAQSDLYNIYARSPRVVDQSFPEDEQRVATAPKTSQVTAQELRLFLTERLPGYMVPSAFVVLDHLPLMPSGKVDRKTLPAPEKVNQATADAYVPPRTPLEQMVAEMWKDILHVERVGVNDNFFELGGHSLLATQFISRLRQELEIDLPLSTLFESPTVVECASAIATTQAEQGNSEETSAVLAELEKLSDQEVRKLLKSEATLTPKGF